MRPSTALVGLLLFAAPVVLAQGNQPPPPPPKTDAAKPPAETKPPENPKPADSKPADSKPPESKPPESKPPETSKPPAPSSQNAPNQITDAPALSSSSSSSSSASSASSSGSAAQSTASQNNGGLFGDATTIAGVGIPTMKVPDTAGAAYMQKSNLPEGTVFICVGAILAFLGAAVLAWRGLVAWSLHRSVKQAARAQNMADLKAMSAVPGKKRGMYNVVGASSNMSLDHLSAAPTGTSRPPKPFASTNTSTPPKAASSLFFSPTAGGSTGLRDSMVNRSSTYLPPGYYAAGNAQPAQGSAATHVGGQNNGHLSTYSLHAPGNRLSARSGVSPPISPSLPPSRGYDRSPPSRDGAPAYRNSVATLGGQAQRGVYQQDNNNPSQLSLNVAGGTNVPGGRAPSAYLEDLFENHGSGSRDRF